MRSLSIVIPVFNSEGSLTEVVARIRKVCLANDWHFEILLVNDGSRDRSWDVLERMSGQFPEVRGIDLARNYGQHNALLCGIRAAKYELVATLDDDLQHPPEELPALIRKLDENFDAVYGIAEKEPHGLWRGAASRLTKWMLARMTGVRRQHEVSAFRVFRTSLREAFHNYRSPHVLIDVLLTWGTSRFAAIPVAHQPRRFGASNYSLARLISHAINLLTAFSTLPLQLASWIGFGCATFGTFVLMWVLGNYVIRGTTQPGFPFLASIITIFAGAQLFSIGILGAYLARVHLRLMDMPQYMVRESREAKAKLEKAA